MPDLAGLRLALTTFTVLPVKSGRVDRRAAAASMAWSPLVGAVLAAAAAGVLVGAREIYVQTTFFVTDYSSLLGAALAIMCLALLTRGLHLDGLADTVDGLASHKPAEQALAVMRDGSVGALGAAALFGCLLIDVLALGRSALTHHGTQSLVLAVVTGRLAMLWSCTPGIPAARHDGLGALVAGSVPRTVAASWTAAVCVGAAIYGRFDTEVGSNRGAVRGVVAVFVALGVAWVVRRHVVRRLGGITGDVLGALCEIAMMTSLLVTAANTR